jgi:hypothetical protein
MLISISKNIGIYRLKDNNYVRALEFPVKSRQRLDCRQLKARLLNEENLFVYVQSQKNQ